MADETRHSRALEAQIITDPDELARKESFNVVEQFRAVADMVETYLQPERPFKLRPSHLLHLHRAALDGITAYAGNWRPAGIEIGDSKHKPPAAERMGLPALVSSWSRPPVLVLGGIGGWKTARARREGHISKSRYGAPGGRV
jgi:fido (protein-threonine AMPylation protein)